MNLKTLTYWTCTAVIAFIFLSSGIFYMMGVPATVEGIVRLGYPLYFVTLLGAWKVLGGLAILVPGFARVKEWAYAGMFIDLTSAAVSNSATGLAWWHVVAPLSVALVLVASWALRPQSRTLGTLFPAMTGRTVGVHFSAQLSRA